MLPVEIVVLVVALGIVGGLVQGTVGFGLGVVASPVIALVRPDLVPVVILVGSSALPIAALVAEWRHVDWRAFAWTLAGRLPATVAGVAIVALVSTRVLQGFVGLVVLLMAVLSIVKVSVPRNGATLASAGALGGVTGTASGIGGPPIAIVMSHDEPAVARATLGVIFLTGSLMSLGGLALAGEAPATSLLAGLVMLPATLIGFAASLVVRRHVSRAGFRTAVLALSGVAAVVLLVKAITG